MCCRHKVLGEAAHRAGIKSTLYRDAQRQEHTANVVPFLTMNEPQPIVDGHLDLAENVTLFGRDLTLSVAEIRAVEKRTTRQATVSLPELERGGIAVVGATVTPGFLAADVGDSFEPRSA